jgi:hypothetical protein
MYENLIIYVVVYILLELYEVQWQKAHTIMGMLARMYEQYKKSAFLFLLMHPTLYFAIYFVMVTEYNPYALALLSIKAADVLTKMLLLKKIFIEQTLEQEMQEALFTPIGGLLPYVGVVLYPFFIVMALL